MDTLVTDHDYLLAAWHAIPRRRLRAPLSDCLRPGPLAKALHMYANALRERTANDRSVGA